MGDYSWCRVDADNTGEKVSHILDLLGLIPEDIQKDPSRYANGEMMDPSTSFIFGEVKSGLDGLSIFLDELVKENIPFTAYDEGCPGVWGEEEVKFIIDPAPYQGSRAILDGAPILTVKQWVKVKDLPNTAELIAGHLSQDVTKWITY